MRAGPFTTKKDAVEAGLKLLARQAAYREILKWEGKLRWDGDDEVDAQSLVTAESNLARHAVNEPPAKYTPARVAPARVAPAKDGPAKGALVKRAHGRR